MMGEYGIRREARIIIKARSEREALEKADMIDDNQWTWEEPEIEWS